VSATSTPPGAPSGDKRSESDEASITLGAGLSLSAVLSFPAAAAVALGGLYGVGALSRSAELSHAGVPVTVALPLIPLTQDLGRGVQIIVQPISFVIAFLFVVAFIYSDRLGTAAPLRGEPTTRRKLSRRWAIGTGVVLLAALLLRPLVLLAGATAIIVAVIVLLLAAPEGQRIELLKRAGPRARVRPGIFLICLIAAVSVWAIGLEFINPQPLPTAALTMADGSFVSGRLITLADGTWYLAQGSQNQIRAVDASAVRSTLIVAHSNEKETGGESLLELLSSGK
jgi:hypothetical protein